MTKTTDPFSFDFPFALIDFVDDLVPRLAVRVVGAGVLRGPGELLREPDVELLAVKGMRVAPREHPRRPQFGEILSVGVVVVDPAALAILAVRALLDGLGEPQPRNLRERPAGAVLGDIGGLVQEAVDQPCPLVGAARLEVDDFLGSRDAADQVDVDPPHELQVLCPVRRSS